MKTFDISRVIARYALRRWKRDTKWPTVRDTAQGLKISMRVIEDNADDGYYWLEAFYTAPPQALADNYVTCDPESELA